MKHNLLNSTILMLASLSLAATESLAATQIRTSGTATGPGSTHLTIESFGKPGDLNLLDDDDDDDDDDDGDDDGGNDKVTVEFEVPVPTGWTCEQTTSAIYDSLTARLSGNFVVTYVSPCTLSIEKRRVDDPFSIMIEENIPGQIVRVYDSAVPTQAVTWGRLKLAHGRSRR
jgi:hypothetical protein